MVAANKRSVMTLFSSTNDLYSHQTRIVSAEKGVSVDVIHVDPEHVSEELAELNPYNTVPTLVDRDLVVYKSRIIMEYLDERFPHPPLMPVYPVARASCRLMMHRIQHDWYSLADRITRNESADEARKELKESILSIAPIFADKPYFMSEEFGLVDCYMAPLLWRLPEYQISLEGTGTKEITQYMKRVFSRNSFKESLTEVEKEIQLGVYE